jgi:hypothetical protein
VLDASTAGGEVRVAAAGSGTSADVIAYVRGDPAEDGARYDRVRMAAPDGYSDTLVPRSDLLTRSAVQRAHAGSLPAKLDRTIRRP